MLDIFFVGAKFKIYYNEGNINNKEIEIRGIVDGHIVYKTRYKDKYLIDEYGYYLEGLFNDGKLIQLTKRISRK
jgi:hypothetical protein